MRPVCSGPGGSGTELIQGVLTSEEHKVWQQLWGDIELIAKPISISKGSLENTQTSNLVC